MGDHRRSSRAASTVISSAIVGLGRVMIGSQNSNGPLPSTGKLGSAVSGSPGRPHSKSTVSGFNMFTLVDSGACLSTYKAWVSATNKSV